MNIELKKRLLKTTSASEFKKIVGENGHPTFKDMGEEVARHFFEMLPHTNTSEENSDPGGFSDPIVETDENGDMWHIYLNRREKVKPNG